MSHSKGCCCSQCDFEESEEARKLRSQLAIAAERRRKGAEGMSEGRCEYCNGVVANFNEAFPRHTSYSECAAQLRSQLAALTEENARLRGALEGLTNKLDQSGTTAKTDGRWIAPETMLELAQHGRSALSSSSSGVLEQVEKALEQAQWGDTDILCDGSVRHCCPICDRTEARGHTHDCEIGKALSSLRALIGRQS